MLRCLSACLVGAVEVLQGCSHCSTVQYRIADKTKPEIVTADVKVSLSGMREWRALNAPEKLVVNGVVLGDAASTIDRLVRYGDVDTALNPYVPIKITYTNLLARTGFAAWNPSRKELSELIDSENVLLKQPNLIQCLQIVLCAKPFPRDASREFSQYQRNRDTLAAAEDGLTTCLAKRLVCEQERVLVETQRSSWQTSELRQAVERALNLRSAVTSQDPENRLVDALTLLDTFSYEEGISADLTNNFAAWMKKGSRAAPTLLSPITKFPDGAVFIDVSPKWFSEDLLASGLVRIPREEAPNLRRSNVAFPKELVLQEIRNYDGSVDVFLLGLLARVLVIDDQPVVLKAASRAQSLDSRKTDYMTNAPATLTITSTYDDWLIATH